MNQPTAVPAQLTYEILSSEAHNQIDELEKLISVLEEVLGPVLTQLPPPSDAGCVKDVMPAIAINTKQQEVLSLLNPRLRGLNSRIMGLMGRVSL